MLKTKYLSVPDAFEQLTGSRPNPTTCWRWAKDSGLETWMIGGRRRTTIEAVQQFIESRTLDAKLKARAPKPSEAASDAKDELARRLGKKSNPAS